MDTPLIAAQSRRLRESGPHESRHAARFTHASDDAGDITINGR